jgi:uncharacterized protein (DUF924 family)
MAGIESRGNHGEPGWVTDVLNFWFSELTKDDWFRKSDVVDGTIRKRFLALHEGLVATGGVADGAAPREILAAIIVFDQFSRNLFRGEARAFAADALALGLARAAVDRGIDASMTGDERLFLYMPFEHSEDIADQEKSVELTLKLGDEGLLHYATAHRNIISRFGRFPHRNAVLGRPSTDDEIEFLKQAGSPF